MATQTPQWAIWRLVNAQHWVITRAQLMDFGFTAAAIRHRLKIGRLHVVHRGVYAVGRRELTRAGSWMAAILSCGSTAFLSHFSAAALWGIAAERGAIEVSVRGGERDRPGIVIHRRSGPIGVAKRDGIPVTSVIDTLIDIAPRLTRNELEAAIREADKRGYTDPERLRNALGDTPPRPGVGILKKILDRRTFRLTDSELERWYLPASDRAGLPRPLTQKKINGERVDFFYPDLKLVVETDGLRYHRTPQQQAKDLVRDQKHLAAGCTPLRFTHEQVRYEPDYVAATLKRVARRS